MFNSSNKKKESRKSIKRNKSTLIIREVALTSTIISKIALTIIILSKDTLSTCATIFSLKRSIR